MIWLKAIIEDYFAGAKCSDLWLFSYVKLCNATASYGIAYASTAQSNRPFGRD